MTEKYHNSYINDNSMTESNTETYSINYIINNTEYSVIDIHEVHLRL